MYSPNTPPIPVDNRGVKSPYAPSPRIAKAGVKITNPETNEPVLLTKSVSSPTSNPSAISSHSSPARSPATISTPVKAGAATDSAAQEKKLQFKELIKKRAAEAEAAQKAAEEKERLEKEAAIKKAEEEAAAKKKAEEEAAAAAQRAKEEAEEKARKQAEEEERAKKQAEEEERARKQAEEEEKAKLEAAAAKEEEEKKAAAAAAAQKTTEKPTQRVDEETVQAALTSIHGKIQAAQPSRNSPVALLEKSTKATNEQLLKFQYPEGVKPSGVHSTQPDVFLYDTPFLLQFQSVVTFPPKENWDNVRSIMNFERGSGSGRQFSSRSNSSRGYPQNMGSFGSSYRSERSGSGPSSGFGMKNIGRMSSNNLNGLGGPSKSGRQNSSRRGRNDRSGSNRGDRQSYNSNNNSNGPAAGEAEPEAPKAPVAPLVRSANAWTPRKKTAPSEDNRLSPEEVQRKVKSLLNKLSLEFFEPITDQLLAICAQSKDEKDGRTLRQVLELTFAKAVDEAHWSKMYAMFCKKMLTKIDPEIYDENIKDSKGAYVKGGVLFRKYLLSKCQEEFERGWSDKLPTNEDGSPLDPALMSDEYYAAVAAKRRGLGLIRFIGELYFLALIAEKIMHACIQMLLSNPDPSEETVESICQLMTTVGGKLEENPATAPLFDSYFERMEEIQKTPGLPSRLRFMLMDVADLRKAHWVDKKKDKGPKTLAEIHEEDEKEKAAAAAASSNNNRNKFTRPNPSNNNRVSKDELKRLSSSSSINRTSSGTSFGPSSMFNRDSSSRGSRRNNDRGDRSERGGDRNNSSAGTPLSKEPSRQPSQRANAFAVLADDGDKSEDK